MPIGRCSGCGETNASAKYMAAHVSECPEYKKLYKDSPELALSPVEEQRRYVEEDGKLQDKAAQFEARQQRAAAHREMNDRKLTMEQQRWSAPTTHKATSTPVTTPDDGQAWGVLRDEVDPESLADLGKRVASWRFNRMM